MNAWTQFEPDISRYLSEEDDPALWEAAVNLIFHEASFLSRCASNTSTVSATIGCCSHWLRPHQTRWTADGGFAWPSGYGGHGYSRTGQPEHDWSIQLYWNPVEQMWAPTEPDITNGTVSQGSYDPATGIFGIGTIASGDTVTLTLEGTVNVGEGGNTITNITTAATGDQVDPSTVGDDLDESVVVNDAADLVTVKTLASGDSTPEEGDTVTFQIDVTNNGAAQATNVSLTDLLPAGITLTGGTVSQGTYDTATGLFDIGTLNVGEIATITLTGTVDAGQGGNTIANVTTAATGDQIDPSTIGDDLVESVDVVDNTTDLVTVKTLASGDVTPAEGDIVTFEITVTNNGVADATALT